jgi:hypothetical protein
MLKLKFTCKDNNFHPRSQTATVTFMPSIIDATEEEAPWTAAPRALIKLLVPVTDAQFTPGDDYYVDFTPVTPNC